MRAIASLTSLIELRLQHFDGVTDAGVLTLSSLTALKSLDLTVPQRYTRSDYDAAAATRISKYAPKLLRCVLGCKWRSCAPDLAFQKCRI